MVLEKRKAEQEDRRPNRQRDVSDNEDISDEDGAADDDGDIDTDDEVIEIPDDPRMVARIAALRAKNQALQARANEEEHIRTLVHGTVEQWKTSVDIIQSEVIRLRALAEKRGGAASSGGAGEGVCKPQEGLHGPRRDDDEDDTNGGQSQIK
jgi:hypothetical protein